MSLSDYDALSMMTPMARDSDDYDSDSGGIDVGLTPLQKLEKYVDSEHSYSR